MPIQNILKLFHTQSGKPVRYLRASTLGHYWYCAVQAWLQAQGIESPDNKAMNIGRRIHDEITASRKPSKWEVEFEDFLRAFMVERESGEGSTGISETENKVFMRAWYDGETVLGHIVTHGVDDFRVYPDRTVIFEEYKTTAQRVIDYYKLTPAIFQLKVYMWIMEPYLKVGGYKLKHGQVVFLTRRGKPLGTKEVYYNQEEVEGQITRILYQFEHPEELIPPARWKCRICPEVYKRRCPFAKKEQQV